VQEVHYSDPTVKRNVIKLTIKQNKMKKIGQIIAVAALAALAIFLLLTVFTLAGFDIHSSEAVFAICAIFIITGLYYMACIEIIE
jgi:protein-S-isoprenylcysteine O-methyltransferase Ste14